MEKGKITAITNADKGTYFSIKLSKSTLKKVHEILMDLKLEWANDLFIDSRTQKDVYDPKKYVDAHYFLDNKSYEIHLIIGSKKIHLIINPRTSKDRKAIVNEIMKYFTFVKPKDGN
ncbi:MAG: hypothetical protein CL675_14040 [Bdellovibrionaceae bacterium]|nr:hypothetical protein [Pseudobdellovibrionaceae bacterium]